MSDDVFEAFGGDDIFDDDEQRQADGEGQNNRTFIVAVAVLGGLLVCAIGSFMLWALVLNRPAPAMEAPVETPTEMVVEEVSVETETPEPTPTLTPTPMPTETPEPTPTPLLGPTSTPTVEGGAPAEGEDDAEDNGDEVDTSSVRRTPTPSPTPRTVAQAEEAAATPGGASGSAELAQTGLGEWLLIGLAVFLLATMVLARRLRSA